MSDHLEIRVRDATLADADFIVACNARLGAETEAKALDPRVLAAGVRRGLGRPELCRYFIAEVDGQRAATTMVTYELTDWRDGVVWWLQSVYVLPEFRRRGVFRAVYRHVDSVARSSGEARALRLYVRSDNTRAIRTYTSLGMAPAGYEVLEDDWTAGV
jgi:ribosomal protein S18 acetylase RimI-like enzyme